MSWLRTVGPFCVRRLGGGSYVVMRPAWLERVAAIEHGAMAVDNVVAMARSCRMINSAEENVGCTVRLFRDPDVATVFRRYFGVSCYSAFFAHKALLAALFSLTLAVTRQSFTSSYVKEPTTSPERCMVML